MGGVEKNIFIKIENDLIFGAPEMDVDRTSENGKASSVQFIHFLFSNDQIEKFKNNKNDIFLGIDHKEYSHTTKLKEETIKSLSKDFN